MEGNRRYGLRVRLSPKKKAARKKNSDKCREYRERLKEDPERWAAAHEKILERNRQYRQRPKSEDELARQRELARLRVQKYRAKQKAEKIAAAHLLRSAPIKPTTSRTTRATTQKDVAATEVQRQKWAQEKRDQRAKWNGSKWRWHRQKNLEAYYRRKERTKGVASKGHEENVPSTPENGTPRTPENGTPRCNRKDNSARMSCELGTPESQKIKSAIFDKLEILKNKRDKKSLAVRKLLLDTLTEANVSINNGLKSSPYKRRSFHSGTTAAVQYLNDIAVDLPGKKSVSKKTLIQKKVLPKRVKRLYRDFKKNNPSLKVSLRTFYRRLPKHIKTVHHQKYRQCLCEICENIDLKLDALNPNLKNILDGRDIVAEMTVCENPSLECYNRKCGHCGVHTVKKYIEEQLKTTPSTTVKWHCWMFVKNETQKQKQKLEMTTTVGELVEELLKGLGSYAKHSFVFRWQHQQYRTCLSKLASNKTKTAVAVIDFSENYHCRYQDEIQSVYWSYNQVTIHPVVLYYPCFQCSKLVTEYLVYLSDDLNHDGHMVNTILQETNQYMIGKGFEKLIVWSDGCAAQYKSKLPFYHLSNIRNIERDFFGSRHGKSPCDACGGVVKQALDTDVLSGLTIIQSAGQAHQHLNRHHAIPPLDAQREDACCHTKRLFKLVNTKDIDRTLPSSALLTVKGTREMHSLKGLGTGRLSTRNLSCYCDFCMTGQGKCSSKKFVLPWKKVQVKFANCTDKKCPGSPHEQPQTTLQDSVPEPLAQNDSSATLQEEVYADGEPEQQRDRDFSMLQQQIEEAQTFEELKKIVYSNSSKKALESYALEAGNFCITDLPGVCIDVESKELLPLGSPDHHLPVTVTGDGNCLPRTLSILAFGHENRHVEMRVRQTIELVQNMHLYLSPQYLQRGSSDDGMKILLDLQRFSDAMINDTVSPRNTLIAEIMRTKNLRQECTMWHLFSAANVLQCPIESVFPDKGPEVIQKLTKRLLRPSQESLTTTRRYIMWTTHRQDQPDDYWAPTHFVPLLKLHPSSGLPVVDLNVVASDSEETAVLSEGTDHRQEGHGTTVTLHERLPVVQDHYLYKWRDDGKTYLIEVKEVLQQDNFIHVEFLKQRGSLYYKATDPETSWEDLTDFLLNSMMVSLQLQENVSSSRIQLYHAFQCHD